MYIYFRIKWIISKLCQQQNLNYKNWMIWLYFLWTKVINNNFIKLNDKSRASNVLNFSCFVICNGLSKYKTGKNNKSKFSCVHHKTITNERKVYNFWQRGDSSIKTWKNKHVKLQTSMLFLDNDRFNISLWMALYFSTFSTK